MKILVSVKRVVDYAARIEVKSDQSGIDFSRVKMSMNPFDEIAMEEAMRLKEKGMATDILAVSIGPSHCQETLRIALARGADRAILLETTEEIQPLAAAKLFKALIAEESPHLVLMGKQAIDSDNNQTGQMLAGLLNWPQAIFASKLEVEGERIRVSREIDGGLETVLLDLPAVVTTDLRLNEPRYLSLPNIVQAKRKPLTVLAAEDLVKDIKPRLKIIKVTSPPKRTGGIKVATVEELLAKLKQEAKVI